MGLKNIVLRALGETKNGENWCDKDIELMKKLKSEGVGWRDIAKQLRRSISGAKRKLYELNKTK